jgi:hypothetical protein
VSLIAALMLALHALRLDPPQRTVALVPLALAGACAGFLIFNLPPARIFMGDSGAEFLGFLLGVSAIIGGAKLATVLLVLGVPILDVAWLIVARTASGRQPAQGGRDHLHHRLLDSGMSARQILALYWGLSASFGLLGIADISPLRQTDRSGAAVADRRRIDRLRHASRSCAFAAVILTDVRTCPSGWQSPARDHALPPRHRAVRRRLAGSVKEYPAPTDGRSSGGRLCHAAGTDRHSRVCQNRCRLPALCPVLLPPVLCACREYRTVPSA